MTYEQLNEAHALRERINHKKSMLKSIEDETFEGFYAKGIHIGVSESLGNAILLLIKAELQSDLTSLQKKFDEL